MQNNHDDGKFWFGFFIGGLLGAIVLFFIGTKEGRKISKDLHRRGLDWGQDIKDELEERLDMLRDKGRELANQGEDIKQQLSEKIDQTGSDINKDLLSKLDSTLSHIEVIQERGRQATADIRKKLFKNAPKKS